MEGILCINVNIGFNEPPLRTQDYQVHTTTANVRAIREVYSILYVVCHRTYLEQWELYYSYYLCTVVLNFSLQAELDQGWRRPLGKT